MTPNGQSISFSYKLHCFKYFNYFDNYFGQVAKNTKATFSAAEISTANIQKNFLKLRKKLFPVGRSCVALDRPMQLLETKDGGLKMSDSFSYQIAS